MISPAWPSCRRAPLIAGFLAGLLLAPTPSQPQEAAHYEGPIIDMHLHAYPIGYIGPAGVPNFLSSEPSPETPEAMLRETLEALERHDVVQAVTSGCPFELVRAWKAAAPDRIVAAPYIAGGRGCWPEPDSLRSAHAAGDVGAIGEFGMVYQGLTLSDPEAEPYLALAEELGIPVGVHTGLGPPGATYDCCPGYRAALADPLLIEDALARHPDLRVYIMHAGFPFLEETLALLLSHPQVYVDISAINWMTQREAFHRYLRELMLFVPERVMFGSDQMIWPDAIGMAIEGVESAAFLTEREKRAIFYDNAARFLRLSDEEIARHHGK